MSQNRDNSGIAFPNKKWEAGSKQPNLRGEATIHGKPMKMSIWVRVDKNGGKYMTFAFEDADAYQRKQQDQQPQPPPADAGGW